MSDDPSLEALVAFRPRSRPQNRSSRLRNTHHRDITYSGALRGALRFALRQRTPTRWAGALRDARARSHTPGSTCASRAQSRGSEATRRHVCSRAVTRAPGRGQGAYEEGVRGGGVRGGGRGGG